MSRIAPSLCFALVLAGCTAKEPSPVNTPATPPADAGSSPAKPVWTGPLDRKQLETMPDWVPAIQMDIGVAKKLASVPPGASVKVVLGTWCGDSRREVPRLWMALDAAGQVPFTVELIGVDRKNGAPTFTGAGTDGLDIRYVPTFVVMRDGKEVGRIIESPATTLEADLLALLDGTKTGVITGRKDL